jgi:hypothetical protein
VLAGETLLVAGPPDLVDQELSLTKLADPETQQRLADQAAAMEGRGGALLLAVSAAEGRKLASYQLESLPVFDGMAAANGCLFLSTVDGNVLCLGSEGEPLKAAPEVELTERREPIASGRAAVLLTSTHPDFQQLTKVQIAASDLGYRIRTPSGQVGLAVKRLESPLTGKVTFKMRLRMISRDGTPRSPGNGFLVFGDEPTDEQTVKCGLRNAGQQSMIVQGPLMAGKSVDQPVESKADVVIDMQVVVDLREQTVRMDLLGKTVETKLEQPLESIKYLGYAVHSVATDFGPIELNGQ